MPNLFFVIRGFSLVPAGLLLCFVIAPALGDDWLRFRGPNGTGVSVDSTPTPARWSETENLKWKRQLPGPGFSSPIVADGRVYVTCWTGYGAGFGKDPEKLKRHLLCIDLATGEPLWVRSRQAVLPEDEFRGVIVETGYASHTPVSDGQNVYAFFGKSGVFAFDPQGKQLWHTSVGANLNSQHYGSASSPIVVDGKIIVVASGESQSIVALDKTTGNIVWRNESEKLASTWSTPVIAATDRDQSEIVVAVTGEIWGIDPTTGERRWRCRSFSSNAVCNSVFSKDRWVFFFSQSGGGIHVTAGGQGTVSPRWRNQAMTQIGTPVEYRGLIFWISHRIAHCVDAETGKYVSQQRLPTEPPESIGDRKRIRGRDYASPVIADGNVYCLTRGGVCYVFAANKEMKLLHQNVFASDESKFGATPAISQGNVLIRSHTHLYCVALTPP